MNKRLLIIGASGHGKVVADIAIKMKKWEEINFLDDDENLKQSLGIDVIGKSKDVKEYINEYDIFVAIGDNSTRKRVQEQIKNLDANIPILIHPSAIIGEDVHIEEGTVIMAGVIINPSTIIGKGSIINTGATVDHDNTIGNYVHISPGVSIAGTVEIGHETWLGIGSIVSNNINITSNCKIGAGGLVVRDINKYGTYIGVPVKIMVNI